MYFAFTQRDSVKSVAAFDVFRRVVCVMSAHLLSTEFQGLGSWSVGVALETDPTVRRCLLLPNVSATSLLRVQDVFAVWRHMFWTFSLRFVQFFCISLSRSYQLKHLQILSYLPNSCNQLTWVSQWESWQSSGRFTRNHVGFENLRPGDAAGLAQGSVACGLRATIPEVWIFWRFLDVFWICLALDFVTWNGESRMIQVLCLLDSYSLPYRPLPMNWPSPWQIWMSLPQSWIFWIYETGLLGHQSFGRKSGLLEAWKRFRSVGWGTR